MIALQEVTMVEFKVPRARRWTSEQARAVLDEIHRRGVSVNRFAAESGLSSERVYRWKRLLGRPRRSSVSPVPRFAELTVRPARPGGPIEIDVPGGLLVRLGGESRVEDAVAILTRLAER